MKAACMYNLHDLNAGIEKGRDLITIYSYMVGPMQYTNQLVHNYYIMIGDRFSRGSIGLTLLPRLSYLFSMSS